MKNLVAAAALGLFAATPGFAQDTNMPAGEIEMSVQHQGAEIVPMILMTALVIAALTSTVSAPAAPMLPH
ncbi:hypothetical protein [Celeribacter sp.]|uniref:hypothetical protein n=1 Tax=Celeribacter sp. TaxID=1890673 RepID=UPI003A9313A6